MKEIIKKYNIINDNRTKVYQMISDHTKVSIYTITQVWFNKSKGINVPEQYFDKVIEVFDTQINYQKSECKHYKQFKK